MVNAARQPFLAALREHLVPLLRARGFKGSGQNFLRVRGETLNALNVQGSRNGEGACINLGLHFTFLPPCWSEEMKPITTFKEVDCEFRWRLSPKGEDHWWEYGATPGQAQAQAKDVAATYLEHGDPVFERFGTAAAVAAAVPLASLESPASESRPPWDTTEVRQALALARIHDHLGDPEQSRRFARFGLEHLGRGTALKAALEALATR